MSDDKKLGELLTDIYERLLHNSQSLIRLRSDAEAFYNATKKADAKLYESFQEELKTIAEQETKALATLHDQLWPVIERLRDGEI